MSTIITLLQHDKKYLDTTWFENYELTPQKEGYRQVYCKKKKKKSSLTGFILLFYNMIN